MRYNPDIHHRRSIRLKNYDYSQKGFYFITLCTQNREDLFGKIVCGRMILNVAGKMIKRIWNELTDIFQNIKLHQFVIMPDHFHGIIEITAVPVGIEKELVGIEIDSAVGIEIDSAVGIEIDSIPTRINNIVRSESISDLKEELKENLKLVRSESISDLKEKIKTVANIPAIVQTFKRYTTIEYIKMVKREILPSFDRRVWQRNYYEHIIRNRDSFLKISKYIKNNPLKWSIKNSNQES
ncbi:hypothetical protein JXR93_04995 [bacterium]|nr:hypothetical protein [bacterium]